MNPWISLNHRLDDSQFISIIPFFIAFHLLSPPSPFWRLSETSATPCSFIVNAHSLSTFSPHSQYTTNAVVRSSYTYSMFSFHTHLFDLNLSVNMQWIRIGKALVCCFFGIWFVRGVVWMHMHGCTLFFFYGDLEMAQTTRMSSFSCNSGTCYLARVRAPVTAL